MRKAKHWLRLVTLARAAREADRLTRDVRRIRMNMETARLRKLLDQARALGVTV